MSGQSVTKLSGNSTSLSQLLRDERGQFVAVLAVTCEGEHLAAQSEKFDTVSIIPLDHLDNVLCIRYPKRFDKSLAPSNICGLFSVWSVFCCVWWLVRVSQRVSILQDRGYSTGPRTKYGRIREAEVRIQACLRMISGALPSILKSKLT